MENYKKKVSGTRLICYCAVMVALLIAGSQVAIPVSFAAAPISLGLLFVLLCGILQPFLAVCCLLIYIFLGAIGLPVFANFGATASLLSPAGGYIFGYIFAAFIAGIAFKYLKNPIFLFFGLCGAVVSCYCFGAVWFAIQTDTAIGGVIGLTVLPFIPLDIIKVVVATIAGRKLGAALKLFPH